VTSTPNPVAAAVTALFVPGNRPDRFQKAFASTADLVIVDLEDAVAPAERGTALRATTHALADAGSTSFAAMVRLSSPTALDQLDELLAAGVQGKVAPTLMGVMVPKAASLDEVRAIVERLPESVACVPLVESAAGVAAASELARIDGVTRLAFGAVDFSLDVDTESAPVLDYARAALVIASRAAGIAPPLDSPSLEISDELAVAAAAAAARRSGFGGKLCIHPAQLAAAAAAFVPSDEQVRWARRVVEADRLAEGAAVQLDGGMIDRPVVDRAKRMLARADVAA
jgi:citrate lyase subunit beta/citryl-CoA lyase